MNPKTVCVCHDIERGFGHVDVNPDFAQAVDSASRAALQTMLAIERECGVTATYNVLGRIFAEVRNDIAAHGHCFGFHSFDHDSLAPQLARCRALDPAVKGYRPSQSRLTAELKGRNLALYDFQWLAGDVSLLGIRVPEQRNTMIWIPIAFDDHDLHTGRLTYEQWEERALHLIHASDFIAFSLHDCYAAHWLPHYERFLKTLVTLGTLKSLDEVANDLIRNLPSPRVSAGVTTRFMPPVTALKKRFVDRRQIRIATVYMKRVLRLRTMDTIRWLRMSESLASLGFAVDMIGAFGRHPSHSNLRFVPFSRVRWDDYQIVKTFFHEGYRVLTEERGSVHPFIISKLGSVVGSADTTPGVHFFGEERRRLYELQSQIAKRSRFVTILTEPSRRLWGQQIGHTHNVLLVPTGVDRTIPPPRRNPYAEFPEKIALYMGYLYSSEQKEISVLWQERLNALGGRLRRKGIRLCFVGIGATHLLDRKSVTCLGSVDNDQSWDYQYFAHVGISLAKGTIQHNESSKLYYYLRTGLPVVSEEPIPNNHLLRESNLGFITPYGDDQRMADLVEAAIYEKWNRHDAIHYILTHHTWDERAKRYEGIIRGLWM